MENEGKAVLQHLAAVGIQEQIRVVDDKYATFENIASSELQGVSLYYKIAKNWKHKPEGEPAMIKDLYQTYHHESDFIPGADLDVMLRYLYRRKEYVAVGSYFRNLRMAEYEEHPEGYQEDLSETWESYGGRYRTSETRYLVR